MRRWTKEELEVLKEICAAPGSMKSKMHALPGRSYYTIKEKARQLELNKERISVAILDLVADGKPRTIRQICETLQRPNRTVTPALTRLCTPGLYQQTHILDSNGTCGSRRFVIGKGVNACLLKKVVPARRRVSSETRADHEYRAKAAWWPRADPVVISSFNAMVHAGRSPA